MAAAAWSIYHTDFKKEKKKKAESAGGFIFLT